MVIRKTISQEKKIPVSGRLPENVITNGQDIRSLLKQNNKENPEETTETARLT